MFVISYWKLKLIVLLVIQTYGDDEREFYAHLQAVLLLLASELRVREGGGNRETVIAAALWEGE
jgi:hypothetical protein